MYSWENNYEASFVSVSSYNRGYRIINCSVIYSLDCFFFLFLPFPHLLSISVLLYVLTVIFRFIVPLLFSQLCGKLIFLSK